MGVEAVDRQVARAERPVLADGREVLVGRELVAARREGRRELRVELEVARLHRHGLAFLLARRAAVARERLGPPVGT